MSNHGQKESPSRDGLSGLRKTMLPRYNVQPIVRGDVPVVARQGNIAHLFERILTRQHADGGISELVTSALAHDGEPICIHAVIRIATNTKILAAHCNLPSLDDSGNAPDMLRISHDRLCVKGSNARV
jgi:hypothetical protein